MRFVRFSMLVVVGFIGSHSAMAEPYSYYQPFNTDQAYLVTYVRSESPQASCYAAVGHNWKDEDKFIIGADWDIATSTCRVVLEDEKHAFPTFVAGSDACPGDDVFSYRSQTCGSGAADTLDEYSEMQASAVVALFAWTTLIGGLLVGFKAGA